MRLTLALTTSLGVAACGAAVPKLPSQGGPAWIELTSEHFTVWTDASKARGVELVGEMEHLHQVVLGTAFRGAPTTGRGTVIAFANDTELHAYLPEMFSALTVRADGSPLRQPLLLLSASSNSVDLRRTETHELVHLISYGVIRSQPHWFAEGLARYFETIQLDALHGTADVGRAPTVRGAVQLQPHLTSIESIISCEAMACMNGNFYATAWALFTYLTNVRPADLGKLEQRLVDTHGDGRRAWDDTFGPGSRGEIDGEMKRWLVSGAHTVLHYDVQLADHAVAVRPLGDADVLAIRALAAGHAHASKASVAAQIDAAIALDPANVLARVDELYLARKPDPTVAHALTAAHPGDWHAWWLLSMAAPPSSGDAAEARRKACDLAAADPAIVPPAHLCPAPAPTAPPTSAPVAPT